MFTGFSGYFSTSGYILTFFVAVPNDISENKEILKVTAVDTLDYGSNALISYSVTGGNGSHLFEVASSNGTVYAQSSLIDQIGQYRTVMVTATDMGIPAQSTTVAVTMLITQENRYQPVVRTL